MDTLLRQIPKVDNLLRLPALNTLAAEVGAAAVTEAVRRTLDRLRADILVGTVTELPSTEALCAQISASCRASRLPSLRGVINATGIVLHTNLGRACLSDRALAAARGVSQGYSTLEYDLTAGERGQRYAHVEPLLCRLTGAEAAVLKERSPSCGSGEIYDGTFTGTLTPGDGVTAALLSAHGIRVYGEDDVAELLRL